MLKEDFTPAGVRKMYFWLAPALAVIPSLLVIAVIPFGSQMGHQKMVIADLNVGILYTFGIVSLGVYGIVLAGYAANSKYPFLGGIRSSAQMISYEISMGMSVIPVFLIAGNLNLSQVITGRRRTAGSSFMRRCRSSFLSSRVLRKRTARRSICRKRNGTGRRLSHGIQLDEIRAVFSRGIFQHDCDVGHDGDAVFRRLDAAVLGTRPAGALRWHRRRANPDFPFESLRTADGAVHLGALDVSAFRYDQLMDLGWRRFVPLALVNILITAVWLWMRSLNDR
jgi:hypothetical protein